MDDIINDLQKALDEAKACRRNCWREDIEEKAQYDGEISAYTYAIGLIKRYKNENGID